MPPLDVGTLSKHFSRSIFKLTMDSKNVIEWTLCLYGRSETLTAGKRELMLSINFLVHSMNEYFVG